MQQQCKIHFVGGYHVNLPWELFPEIIESIRHGKSNFEHDGQLFNLNQYEHISLESAQTEVERYIDTQSPEIKEQLLLIKKMRVKKYPYKRPFANVEHVDQFIKEIKKWKFH